MTAGPDNPSFRQITATALRRQADLIRHVAWPLASTAGVISGLMPAMGIAPGIKDWIALP